MVVHRPITHRFLANMLHAFKVGSETSLMGTSGKRGGHGVTSYNANGRKPVKLKLNMHGPKAPYSRLPKGLDTGW